MTDNIAELVELDDDGPTRDASDEALEAAAKPTSVPVSLSQPNLFTCAIGCC